MKILIVDDEYLFRDVVRSVLSDYGDCQTVTGGAEAMAAFIQAHAKDLPFNLITMDIMMPEMNGIETLKKIRRWESAQNIAAADRVKIVMVTGGRTKQALRHSFLEGCEAYVIKPLNKEKFVEALGKLGLIEGK